MKKTTIGSIVVLSTLLLGNVYSAQAQVGLAVGMGLNAATGGRWYQPYGYGGYGGYYGGGTVAEGYGRGMADVIRAQGESNKANAEAQLTREEARARYIDNNKKAADTYWAMKDQYRQEQAAERQRKKERADKNRKKLEYSQAQSQMRGLGPDDFDPVTGKIQWPEVLQQEAYAKYRTELEGLFEQRTLTGRSAANGESIQSAAAAMRNELKQHIAKIPSMDYIAARKFLEGLAYEGQN